MTAVNCCSEGEHLMKYNVQGEIGENCITMEDGQKVYAQIHPRLQAKENVELDFAGVKIVASPFLNAAIGQLLRDTTPDDLNSYLRILNLSLTARPILRRVIENAKAYYSSDEMREAVDEVIDAAARNSDAN